MKKTSKATPLPKQTVKPVVAGKSLTPKGGKKK